MLVRMERMEERKRDETMLNKPNEMENAAVQVVFFASTSTIGVGGRFLP